MKSTSSTPENRSDSKSTQSKDDKNALVKSISQPSSLYHGFSGFWDNHDSEELKLKVKAYLEKELETSKAETQPTDNLDILMFRSERIPPEYMSFPRYIDRLIKYLNLTVVIHIAALNLFQRMRQIIPLDILTIHRLWLTALYVAYNGIRLVPNNTTALFERTGGINPGELEYLERLVTKHHCTAPVNPNEHHAMLSLLLEDEINHDSCNSVLSQYIPPVLCNIITSYISPPPSKELEDYVSYCRLFTPKAESNALTSSPKSSDSPLNKRKRKSCESPDTDHLDTNPKMPRLE